MDFYTSFILGVIQGLTEFIPVSSSGHLVLAQKYLPGFSQPGVVLDVFLHLGTLIAVLVYFRKKIISVIFDRKYITTLVIGTLPAVIIGIAFKDWLESTYHITGVFLGIQFLITALMGLLTDAKNGTKKTIDIKDSLTIGCAQAFSILPAVSRSGSTIFTAVWRGVSPKEAAEYSFLLSVPAILGANILELYSYKEKILPLPPSYWLGMSVSFVVGILSIYLTISLLTKRMFKVFAFYTIILGVIVMLL